MLHRIGRVLVANSPLDRSAVDGLFDDIASHRMTGAVGCLAFDLGNLVDIIPTLVDDLNR